MEQAMTTPLNLGIIIATGTLLTAFGWYIRGRKSRIGKKVLSEMLADRHETPETRRLLQNLTIKCLHDDVTVNRLIDAERERNPGGTNTDWLRAAINRWERDNRDHD